VADIFCGLKDQILRNSVLSSAGIGLIFTRSWLGWPKQPIKWDVLYHV